MWWHRDLAPAHTSGLHATSLGVPIMERTLAAELTGVAPGREVRLQGWLHRRRRLAEIDFLALRDRTGLAQVVVTEPAARSQVAELVEEAVIEVTGRAVANDRAPYGIEVGSPRISVLGQAEPTPVELWRPALRSRLPTVLDHAPLTWRHPRQRARWQLAAAALRGFRRHLDAAGYIEVQTPKIVGAVTESGTNVFALDYFGRPAYLAQSPQFYKHGMPPHGGFAIGLERFVARLTGAENIREVALFPRDLHRQAPGRPGSAGRQVA